MLPSRIEREINDELRFHVQEEIDTAVQAGLTPDEARRAAYASLGGSPVVVREACRDQRGISFVQDFGRDLTYGARLLRRNPSFATVVLAALGISIGAAVSVFSIVDAWLLRPLNFPDANRLAIAFAARPERPSEPAVWLPFRVYLAWKDRSRSFTSLSAAFYRDVTVTTATDARSALGLSVTPEFFEAFGVSPLLGRTLLEEDVTGPQAIVLSYGFWQREFGGSGTALGDTVMLSGIPHEIVGVMPRNFDVRMLEQPESCEFWTPFRPGERGYEPDGIGPVAIIGRLRRGTTIEIAQSELAAITRETESNYQLNFNQFLINLSSLQADNTRTVRATLLTVSAAVVCLLLIAAMNVGTLLLGRGLGRMREAAIRIAIGSARSRLLRQFLTESLLISLIGGSAGLALAAVAIRLFVGWNPLGTLPANAIQFDLRVFGAAVFAMGVTTIVCGLVPALRMSTADPNDALRAGGERGPATPAQRAQTAMLVAQMAASVVLLVATTLLIRTFARLQSEPLGFEAKNLWVANVILPNDQFDSSEKRNSYYGELADRIRALPGVRAVAAGTSRPLNAGAPVTVNTGPEDSPNAPRISSQEVTTAFFDTLEIPIVAGRAFDERDGAHGSPVVIVNARAARDLFGGPAAAIGRRVRLNREPWREVVGVVGGVRSTFFNTLEWQVNPIVYRPAAQAFTTLSSPTATSFGFNLHIRSDRPLTMADVRHAASSVSQRTAVTEFRPASEMIAEATRQPAFRMTLLVWFAAASLLLAAIGVYGLVSQAVAQRLREIAIRLALGAEPAAVIGTITRRAFVAGVTGLLTGGLAAFMLGNTLETLLYGVQPRDAVSFAAAGATLLAVAAVGAFVPAFRATRIDPAKVLRAD
jgi:predicted permease